MHLRDELTVILCGYVPVSSRNRHRLKRRFSKLSLACSSVSALPLTLSRLPSGFPHGQRQQEYHDLDT